MKLLFHLHTHHSFDSMVKPATIIEFALVNGIRMIAITDHGTIDGSVEAQNIVREKELPLEIIIGAEYLTDSGDIVGLFLKEEIREKSAEKLIDQIHQQGGLAILPHPYYHHTLSKSWLDKIDVIEVFNPRCTEAENKQAAALAKRNNKPGICGVDAHLASELKLCVNTIEDQISPREAILSEKEYTTSYTSKSNILRSQIIKGYKTRNVALILMTLKSLVLVKVLKALKRRGNNG